jgi:hypothetical protein
VEAARTLDARDLSRALAHWRQLADAAAAASDEALRQERRRLHVSPTLDRMVRVDGDLDAEGGQVVITALRAEMDARARSGGTGGLAGPRLRADALIEICRRYLDSADRPTVAGERPHLIVTLDLEALEGRAGYRCELTDTGVITPEAARTIACDASVSRVITKGPSEPLDVGRRTPAVSQALRRALIVRDGGCRFPGCDRPHAWCDVHHVRHWADGGETSLANTALLCRPHHGLVHDGFRMEPVGNRIEFSRPDGTVLEDRAPP